MSKTGVGVLGVSVVGAVAVAMLWPRFTAQPEVAPAEPSAVRKGVVQAPPLQTSGTFQNRTAVGSGAASCRNCGVVQMVVAVHGYAQPAASAYQMHIRMDDGTVRTVEQRGALAAGSRVIVERDSVRMLAGRAAHG